MLSILLELHLNNIIIEDILLRDILDETFSVLGLGHILCMV